MTNNKERTSLGTLSHVMSLGMRKYTWALLSPSTWNQRSSGQPHLDNPLLEA